MNKIFRAQLCGVLTHLKQTHISEFFSQIHWRSSDATAFWTKVADEANKSWHRTEWKTKIFWRKRKMFWYLTEHKRFFIFLTLWSHVEMMIKCFIVMEDSLLKMAQELWRQWTYIVLGLVYICIAHLYERTLQAYFHIMILASTHRTLKYLISALPHK